ncbi:hypothetical protein TNCV_4698841 [Trichonephila clavipes]|nr:hypothetical protein TNCV_4698841 [Trichonephila clavipes]
MKGVTEDLFKTLLARDVQTWGDFPRWCLYIEEMKQKRLRSCKFKRLPNVVSIAANDEVTDLMSLIRQVVREKIIYTPYEVPITDAIPNFQPVAKPRGGKLSRSPTIGGEVTNFRNPPLAVKLQGNHINVFINNQPVKSLVDSVISDSVISETYRRKQRKVMFLDTKLVILKVADGNYVKPLDKCVLQLTINDRTQPFQFTAMLKCSHDVILGFDFLKASQTVLDCGRVELIFNELLHDDEIDPLGIKLYALSDSVIPARSGKFLTVQARDAQDDTGFLVEGNKVMCINQRIVVLSMITSLRKGKASFWLTNCKNQASCIPKGMCIANAEPARSECLNTLTEVPSYTDLWTSKCSDQIDYSRIMASTLSVEQKNQIKSLSRQFQDAFHSETQQRKCKLNVEHKINTGTDPSLSQRPYRVSSAERCVINDEVDKMLKRNIIRPFEIPWSSPVVLVRKKDESWRFCVDYRRLNQVTKKDVYPLPRIDDTLDCLKGVQYFSSMDMHSSYW